MSSEPETSAVVVEADVVETAVETVDETVVETVAAEVSSAAPVRRATLEGFGPAAPGGTTALYRSLDKRGRLVGVELDGEGGQIERVICGDFDLSLAELAERKPWLPARASVNVIVKNVTATARSFKGVALLELEAGDDEVAVVAASPSPSPAQGAIAPVVVGNIAQRPSLPAAPVDPDRVIVIAWGAWQLQKLEAFLDGARPSTSDLPTVIHVLSHGLRIGQEPAAQQAAARTFFEVSLRTADVLALLAVLRTGGRLSAEVVASVKLAVARARQPVATLPAAAPDAAEVSQ